MTAIKFCPNCSNIESIENKDINGAQHMDTPEATKVRACLDIDGLTRSDETVESELWEIVLILVTMDAYDGKFSEYELEATPFTPIEKEECPECAETNLAQVLLAVSVIEEQMKEVFECKSCGFNPESQFEWDGEFREYDEQSAYNHLCPNCERVVWTEWLECSDVDESSTYDYDGYGELIDESENIK